MVAGTHRAFAAANVKGVGSRTVAFGIQISQFLHGNDLRDLAKRYSRASAVGRASTINLLRRMALNLHCNGLGKRRRFPLVGKESQMLGYGVLGSIVLIVLVVYLVRGL